MRSEYRGIRLGRYGTMPEGKNGKPVPAAIVGLGFGDEGKGMAVAHEVGRSRACGLDAMVVRFNGGPQAAHNVRVVDRDGNIRHHTHAQFGSGALLGADTVLTKGMLVNPMSIGTEADALARTCDDPEILSRLIIDRRCPVTLPLHARANRALERKRGAARHGSTGLGIGIARACEHAVAEGEVPGGMLVNVGAIMDGTGLAEKIAFWSRWVEGRFGVSLATAEDSSRNEARMLHDTLEELTEAGMRIVDDATEVARQAMADGWTGVTFEGSQGILLDERHGWFPHVTYGDMTADNAFEIAAGLPLRVLGITRTYQTRHGAGPMPTEGTLLADEPDNATSEWAGAFRTGLLDVPTLGRAARAVRPDSVAVSCLDRYPGRYVSEWSGERTHAGCERPVPTGPTTTPADESGILDEIRNACGCEVTVLGRGDTTSAWADVQA